MLRISVDFNTMMQDIVRARVIINTDVAVNKHLLPDLKTGLKVTLYEADDMEVDAVLEFDEVYQAWLGVPDWSTRRDLPTPD